MKLLEYEAKSILRQAGLLVPTSTIIKKNAAITASLPCVLKSQVPVGGRGKLGGIKVAESAADFKQIVDELFNLPIKGYLPSKILAEEKLAIQHEYYLSLVINQSLGYVELVAHIDGGMEVEDNNTADFLRLELTGINSTIVGEQLAEYLGREDQSFILQDMTKRLYDCFIKNDVTLIEINPLIYTNDDRLVCGDAKIELDDAAAFRHPDWQFEETIQETNFVTLNEGGTVATIANGAGLAMATVDAVVAGGMAPANFLDIGGGASEATVLAAFEQIVTFPNIQAIVINIFAGITRCDEVARAIVAAREKIDTLPPLFIRLAGTNYEQAADILLTAHIPLLLTLEECIAKAKEVTNG